MRRKTTDVHNLSLLNSQTESIPNTARASMQGRLNRSRFRNGGMASNGFTSARRVAMPGITAEGGLPLQFSLTQTVSQKMSVACTFGNRSSRSMKSTHGS